MNNLFLFLITFVFCVDDAQFVFEGFSFAGQFGFQEPATSFMLGIIDLHHYIFFLIIIVLFFVFYIMFRTYNISCLYYNFKFYCLAYCSDKHWLLSKLYISFYKQSAIIKKLNLYATLNVSHGTFLEIIWTIIPSLILLCIVGPSFSLLFALDTISNAEYTFKILGHQWYWSYEYNDHLCINLDSFFVIDSALTEIADTFDKAFVGFNSLIDIEDVADIDENPETICSVFNECIASSMVEQSSISKLFEYNALLSFDNYQKYTYSFDSYMRSYNDLFKNELRLLAVDIPLYLPVLSQLRFDITSDDVMHAFAIPSLGLKIDAIPGRLNIIYVKIAFNGIYYGQCSELCGVNHGFMPIKLVVLPQEFFQEILFNFFLESDSFFTYLSLGDLAFCLSELKLIEDTSLDLFNVVFIDFGNITADSNNKFDV